MKLVVEEEANWWVVYSLVDTKFGSKPAKNFVYSGTKEACHGFVAGWTARGVVK